MAPKTARPARPQGQSKRSTQNKRILAPRAPRPLGAQRSGAPRGRQSQPQSPRSVRNGRTTDEPPKGEKSRLSQGIGEENVGEPLDEQDPLAGASNMVRLTTPSSPATNHSCVTKARTNAAANRPRINRRSAKRFESEELAQSSAQIESIAATAPPTTDVVATDVPLKSSNAAPGIAPEVIQPISPTAQAVSAVVQASGPLNSAMTAVPSAAPPAPLAASPVGVAFDVPTSPKAVETAQEHDHASGANLDVVTGEAVQKTLTATAQVESDCAREVKMVKPPTSDETLNGPSSCEVRRTLFIIDLLTGEASTRTTDLGTDLTRPPWDFVESGSQYNAVQDSHNTVSNTSNGSMPRAKSPKKRSRSPEDDGNELRKESKSDNDSSSPRSSRRRSHTDSSEEDEESSHEAYSDLYRKWKAKGDLLEARLHARGWSVHHNGAEYKQKLTEDTVTRAITAVTEAITCRPGGQKFAYANPYSFANFNAFGVMTTARRGYPLLMPYTTQPQPGSMEGNHTRSLKDVLEANPAHTSLFSLAPREDVDGNPIPHRFAIHHYDSIRGSMAPKEVLHLARQLSNRLMGSGWRRKDQELKIEVGSVKDIRSKDPDLRQMGAWECAYFTVFRAWAIALGLPPATQSSHRTQKLWPEATDMVNLAIHGTMCSRTIEKFLKQNGFADHEAQVPADRHFPETVRFDDEKCLDQYMESLQQTEGP